MNRSLCISMLVTSLCALGGARVARAQADAEEEPAHAGEAAAEHEAHDAPPGTADAHGDEVESEDEHDEAEKNQNPYGRRGARELGGDLSFRWNAAVTAFSFTPTLGYFVRDRIELSLRGGVTYLREREDDGTTVRSAEGFAVFEPSYHHPIENNLFFMAGLGVGFAHDGTHAQLDILPRVGLNVLIGASGVFTIAMPIPIYVGRNQGPGENDFGVLAGVGAELGYSTMFGP